MSAGYGTFSKFALQYSSMTSFINPISDCASRKRWSPTMYIPSNPSGVLMMTTLFIGSSCPNGTRVHFVISASASSMVFPVKSTNSISRSSLSTIY